MSLWRASHASVRSHTQCTGSPARGSTIRRHSATNPHARHRASPRLRAGGSGRRLSRPSRPRRLPPGGPVRRSGRSSVAGWSRVIDRLLWTPPAPGAPGRVRLDECSRQAAPSGGVDRPVRVPAGTVCACLRAGSCGPDCVLLRVPHGSGRLASPQVASRGGTPVRTTQSSVYDAERRH